jgi:hypothetical protein
MSKGFHDLGFASTKFPIKKQLVMFMLSEMKISWIPLENDKFPCDSLPDCTFSVLKRIENLIGVKLS